MLTGMVNDEAGGTAQQSMVNHEVGGALYAFAGREVYECNLVPLLLGAQERDSNRVGKGLYGCDDKQL